MYSNQFKLLFRNFFKNKSTNAINILGLSVGMAVAILIGLWSHHQINYDTFHQNRDQIFRVVSHDKAPDGKVSTVYSLPIPLADYLENEIPEVEKAVVTDWGFLHGLKVGNNKFSKKGLFTSSNYLEVYQFPLIEGNAVTALQEPESIVLTHKMAIALFDKENAMGKTVRLDNQTDLKVTGVLEDIPANSTIEFDYLIPLALSIKNNDWVSRAATDWRYPSFQVYVLLNAANQSKVVTDKIRNVLSEKIDNSKNTIGLFPMKNNRLKNKIINGKQEDGIITYVRLFLIIGIFILGIAIINFINLSTANSEKRAKEVGVRKTLGARRKNLILQFLSESYFITFIAFLVSFLMVDFALPYFNELTKETITLPYGNHQFWAILISLFLVTGLLSGLYPAFFLSHFKPIDTLKNKVHYAGKGSGSRPRKILVTSQFAVSITLIITTIIVWQQINHVANRPKGYTADRLLMIEESADLQSNRAAIDQALLQLESVEKFTRASTAINGVNNYVLPKWTGKNPNDRRYWPRVSTGWNYTATLGIELLEGRDFSVEIPSDSTAILINKVAAQRMNMENPIGEKVEIFGAEKTIIGVIDQVVMTDPNAPVDATIIECNPHWAGSLMLRLKPNIPIVDAIAELKPVFDQYNPALPFDYTFADEAYVRKLGQEKMIGKLASIFGIIAILISCLGLFGLAAFMAERRSKELGIRKVLGASAMQLWTLLNKDFLTLIFMGTIIAIPIALYTMNNWLDNYEYRINIDFWVFLIGSGIVLIISVLTMSLQTMRAARVNPVEALRDQ